MSIKARFTFIAEAASHDPRTTVVHVRYFQLEDDDTIYAFPESCIELEHHDKLMELPSARTAKKNLKVRGTRRSPKITLPPGVAELYVDDDGNPVFNGTMLDDFVPTSPSVVSTLSSVGNKVVNEDGTETLVVKPKSLAMIMKDAVLPKFGIKRTNAEAWLDLFEMECKRLEVEEERFWEALRLFLEKFLFLEKSPADWFETQLITLKNKS